jgi:hypothetical protein
MINITIRIIRIIIRLKRTTASEQRNEPIAHLVDLDGKTQRIQLHLRFLSAFMEEIRIKVQNSNKML